MPARIPASPAAGEADVPARPGFPALRRRVRASVFPLVLSLAAGAAPSPAAPAGTAAASMRVLIAPSALSGWMRPSAADPARREMLASRRRQLDWYASLGFTHVVYPVDIRAVGLFRRGPGGAWVYNGGRHDGDPDSSFRAMKAEVEARGMRLIPQVNALSHADAIIRWVDSTVSEFPSRAAFLAFAAARGLPQDRGLDHVAAPVDNPAADRIFAEFLGIVRANWGNTPLGGARPSHVLIGHDELGYDSVCFVKAGRSRTRPESPARLVAMEIAARVRQVDSVLGGAGGGPDVLLYGDSFLPSDLGERYGLAGEPGTGRGGTLAHLAESPALRDRLLVVPWNYLLSERERHYWSRLPFSRARQLALLDTLGFRYLVGVGEHGSNGGAGPGRFRPPYALGNRDATERALYQWLQAARRRPRGLAGYAHQTFEPFETCSPAGLCTGYTAPLLAWMAWTPGSPFLAPGALERPWNPALARGLQAARSRRELRWTAGVHHPRPVP